MSDLITAIGIVLLLEGLLYAAFPDMMRRAAAEVSRVDPEVLRLVGLLAGISGLATLWLVRG